MFFFFLSAYNFQQGRVTDHRVGLTLHSLDQVLQGEGLEIFAEALEKKRILEFLETGFDDGGDLDSPEQS